MYGREKHFQQQAKATTIPKGEKKQQQQQQASSSQRPSTAASGGAFIAGRSPGSINIFELPASSSSSAAAAAAAATTKQHPVEVGSKHYKHLKAVQENEGILKPREVGATKTDRAGLRGGQGGKGKAFKNIAVLNGKKGNNNDEPIFAIDERDPNYNSEEEEEEIISRRQARQIYTVQPLVTVAKAEDIQKTQTYSGASPPRNNYDVIQGLGSSRAIAASSSKLTLQQFKVRIVDLLSEYSVSEDVDEFVRSLTELNCAVWHYELVRRAITLAMERNTRERELVSRLLALITQHKVLTTEQAGKGFERLFELADDLALDIPKAKDYIARFLARAVADEILPPSFLMNSHVASMGGEMVEQAKALLSVRHGSARLEHIWGAAGDVLPVDELKQQINMILQEYLASADLEEAANCVKGLHVPHFHHDLVKRAVMFGMDHNEKERAMMSALLAHLSSQEILTSQQLLDGYARCVKALPDLSLDTPNAEAILRVFIMQSVSDGNLSPKDAANLLA